MELTDRDWVELVKVTREKFDVSIDSAHDLILTDEKVRRLVALRINSDTNCRTLALHDLRKHGNASRFIIDGARIKFREGED